MYVCVAKIFSVTENIQQSYISEKEHNDFKVELVTVCRKELINWSIYQSYALQCVDKILPFKDSLHSLILVKIMILSFHWVFSFPLPLACVFIIPLFPMTRLILFHYFPLLLLFHYFPRQDVLICKDSTRYCLMLA